MLVWGPGCLSMQVWESLVLEQGVKNHLLEYSTSALLFTDKGVSKNIISWNRYVHVCVVANRRSEIQAQLTCFIAQPLLRRPLAGSIRCHTDPPLMIVSSIRGQTAQDRKRNEQPPTKEV